jgi:hypothetical protein
MGDTGKKDSDKQLQFPHGELVSKPENEVWMQFETHTCQAFTQTMLVGCCMMGWMKRNQYGVS